jgi:hypothetical protein
LRHDLFSARWKWRWINGTNDRVKISKPTDDSRPCLERERERERERDARVIDWSVVNFRITLRHQSSTVYVGGG